MKNIKILGALITALLFAFSSYGQLNGNFNTVRLKAGNDTTTFSPQTNGTLLYGNGGNLYFKTATSWSKLNSQSTSNTSAPPSKIYFPPGSDANQINPDYLVMASGTLRNSYHNTGITPPFNDTIRWSYAAMSSTGYSNTFFDTIRGIQSDKHLRLSFPAVKAIIGGSIDQDEVSTPYLTFWGSQKFTSHSDGTGSIDLQAYQQISPGIVFTGNGGASWTLSGPGYDNGFFPSIQNGNGFASFGMSPLLTPYQAPTEVLMIYYGPNNYHIQQYLTGTYGNGFYLKDLSGNTVTTPTANDRVVCNVIGAQSIVVDLYQWRTYNNWLRDLSSFNITLMVEVYLKGVALSSTSVQLNWQSVTGATQYKIYRSTTRWFSSPTLIYTGTANTYTDTGLTTLTKYYYKLVATVSGVDTFITYYPVKTL